MYVADAFMSHLLEAWNRLQPRLAADPDELQARLARRRLGVMKRPPRAWCVTLRASDTRLTPATAEMAPEAAAWPQRARRDDGDYEPHDVRITSDLLRRLCAPVYLPRPGMPKSLVAEKLGCSQSNLEWAQRRGMFTVFRDMAPADRFCWRPVTYLYTREPLDPSSPKLRKFPDPLWGTTARFVADHIPDDIDQTIGRVPLVQAFRFGHTDELRARPPRMLFRGWKWVCPACRKTCRVLYYPLWPLYGIQLLKRPPTDKLDWLAEPLAGFACTRCHDVLHFTRINADAWNHLICHLSGGLLYGHEVPLPEGVTFERKREKVKCTKPRPAPLRDRVEHELKQGLSYGQIAWKLRLTKSTIASTARRIYQRHGTPGAKEFREMSRGRVRDDNVEA